jgi:DHA2 family multidrug resistance protein
LATRKGRCRLSLPLSHPHKLAIFLVMAVGQFMALLDIQIVVASLSAIQGGLSASVDEIDWIQTAYLMAEIVMIPLSAYLAEALSTRWMFVASAGLFTLSSLLCGLAWDLPSMIAFRAIQGFVGGAMVPLVFATGFSFFDGGEAAMATALLGVIATLAPALGPTIGGWITESFGWRWLFLINVPPGLLVTMALAGLGPVDEARPRLLFKIDWLHAASLAAFLGGLQYVLEEGPRRQWLEDRGVAATAWIAFVAAVVFLERCRYSPRPLVRLHPFRYPGFGAATLLSFVVGFGIYTGVYLIPAYLARVRGYSSLDIGATVFVSGVFMTLSAPPAAWLATRIDQRILMAIGLVLSAVSFWMLSGAGPDWGFDQLLAPQAVRGAAVLFTMVPVVGMALADIPPPELGDASGLSNLMRNLGGAVGIAVANTWLLRFFSLHLAGFAEPLGAASGTGSPALPDLAMRLGQAGSDPSRAFGQAAATLGGAVAPPALSLAFDDVFRATAWLFAASIVLAPFCRGGPLQRGREVAPRRHEAAAEHL